MSKTFCADALIIDNQGYRNALVFEKLWFLIHKSENAADYAYEEDGKLWEDFTYTYLATFFDATKPNGEIINIIGAERSVRRAIDELVTAGLIVRRRRQVGVSLAINFKALENIVGTDGMARYGVCPDVDKDKNSVCPDVDKQLPASLPNVQMWTDDLSNSGHSVCPDVDTPYIYDSESESENESKDSTPTSVGDADASPPIGNTPVESPEEDKKVKPVQEKILSMRQLIFGMWQRLTYGEKKEKDGVGSVIDNLRKTYGEEFVYDALEQGRFEAYLILTDDWFVEGKIEKPWQLVKGFEFMVEYENKNGRNWYEQFTSKFPDWRESSAKGQYSAFVRKAREAVPQLAKKKAEKSSSLPSWRTTPYGATPVAEDAKNLTEADLREIFPSRGKNQ